MEKNGIYCYKHPQKIAIQDCSECHRPICYTCLKESGTPPLCPDCERERIKEAIETERAPGGQDALERERERKTLELGEITVTEEAGGTGGKARPIKPISLKGKRTEPPSRESAAEVTTPTQTGEAQGAGDITRRDIEQRAAKRSGETPLPGIPLEPAKAERRSQTGQLLSVLPGGAAVALWSAGFWGMLGLISQARTGVATLFTGILVSFVLVKLSTRKKDASGRRVWDSPPPPLLTGTLAVILTAVTIPLTEYFFYKGILGGSPELKLGFGAYWTSEFLGTTDYILIALGLVAAFVIPFIWSLVEGKGLGTSFHKYGYVPRASKRRSGKARD